ncbi:MAG TPA: acyltransferase [Casimicrobiaceae bacterium]|nr:acyltransferase [Casimicrobiaceae bacterium]
MPRLASLAQGRDNNFQLIRLLSASAVVLFHSYALTNHWTDEPLWKRVPELNFGALGVACFFVISGFLVTQSWLARRRVQSFVAARVLRIYPALLAAVVLTVVLAGASSALGWRAFLGHPQTLDYVMHVAPAWEMRHQLPGAFAGNPVPLDVNGSLWTLPIELRLYVAVLAAGVAGLLAQRSALTLSVCALFAIFLWNPAWLAALGIDGVTRDLAVLFVLGSLACAWRDAIPVSLAAAAGAVVLLVVNPAGMARGAFFAPLLAYLVLVAAYHPRLQWRAFNGAGDYSYGVYVYSFPTQQALIAFIPGVEPMPLFGMAMAATLALSALSWHVLESPALRLKSRFGFGTHGNRENRLDKHREPIP